MTFRSRGNSEQEFVVRWKSGSDTDDADGCVASMVWELYLRR